MRETLSLYSKMALISCQYLMAAMLLIDILAKHNLGNQLLMD